MDNKPAYTHICVLAQMDEAVQHVKRRQKTGTQKVQRIKGILKPEKVEVEEPIYEFIDAWEPTGEISDTNINVVDFGERIEEACNHLHQEGYEVIQVTPILSGVHKHKFATDKKNRGGGFGYGYSITSAFMIVGKLYDMSQATTIEPEESTDDE